MNVVKKMVLDKILREYDSNKETYARMRELVTDKVNNELKNNHIRALFVSSRVKERESLHGKLLKKSDKYTSLSDITDILGLRIVLFFADDVDKVGQIVKKYFNVDWDNSIDKRKSLAATEFGYLSLHYICSVKPETDPELSKFKFEIQIRTGLQHIWAEIEHDIGYKSKFGIPRDIRRLFSKMASLLEIADDEFLVIRDSMESFVTKVRKNIAKGKTEDIDISIISLEEYIANSEKIKKLLEEIAKIDCAEINVISPDSYVAQLDYLGKKTLADIDKMIDQNGALALSIAQKTLNGLELDILSSNVSLLYLCRAELVTNGMSKEEIAKFYELSNHTPEHAERQAEQILRMRTEYK